MLKIFSNHHERQFSFRYEVPKQILVDDFEWLDAVDGFFKYLGTWFHVSEFSIIPKGDKSFPNSWEGFISHTYFSGTLIKLSDDRETYQVATYFG